MDREEHAKTIRDVEELFGIKLPLEASQPGRPRELVDWLDAHVSGKKPNTKAAKFLTGLAKLYERPELIENLEQPWRREQIAAVIRGLYAEEDPQWLRRRALEIVQSEKID